MAARFITAERAFAPRAGDRFLELREATGDTVAPVGTNRCHGSSRSYPPAVSLASVHPETLSFWNRWLNSDF